MNIAGILRAGAFSPNHIGNDAAILNMVAEQLRKRGVMMKIYSEEQLLAGDVSENIIVNMCRETRSIELLQKYEDNGRLIINSGYGIENCVRERMTRILIGSGISFPESMIVNTNEVVKNKLTKAGYGQCWIKRADMHSQHKEDVSYVRHAEEAQELLQEYFYRGIKRATINKHLEGDLVKFYGVKGQPFFFIFYPFDKDSTLNSHNVLGPRQKNTPLEKTILSICHHASDELNVDIFGGECIVDKEGKVWLIDFNDWPSYAPCRGEAASFIAKNIISSIKNYNQ